MLTFAPQSAVEDASTKPKTTTTTSETKPQPTPQTNVETQPKPASEINQEAPSQPNPEPTSQPETQPEPTSQPETKTNEVKKEAQVATDETDAYKLIISGTGESGKTTFTRQLKLKYQGGFSDQERTSFVHTIRANLIEAMQCLLIWTEKNGQPIDSDHNIDAESISTLDAFNVDFDYEISEHLSNLWEDESIQIAFQHRAETVVPDHIDYFFGKLTELTEPEYIPTDEDIIRARIRTIGVDSITLAVDGAPTKFYDVGGQKNERSKWNNITNIAEGAIYVVSLSDFDKPMFEDTSAIRIEDALEAFQTIVNDQHFTQAPIFLIANKYDGFQEKIKNSDAMIKVFPDYHGDIHDPEQCSEFILNKFIELAPKDLPNQKITTYKISALDVDQVVETTTSICKFISDNYFS